LSRLVQFETPSLIYASWAKAGYYGFPEMPRKGVAEITRLFYPLFNKLNQAEKDRIGEVYRWIETHEWRDDIRHLDILLEFYLSLSPKNRLLSHESSWTEYTSKEADPCYQIKELARILFDPRAKPALDSFPPNDPTIGLQWRPFPEPQGTV
jgi:hypothetical protein